MPDRAADHRLVTPLKDHDSTALADLERLYASRIYQLAFRYMKNHEDAEEVTQDVLLRVHQNVDAFRGEAAPSSWVYRITFNAAMSRLRSANFKRALEVRQADLDVRGDDAGVAPVPSDVADWSSPSFHRSTATRCCFGTYGACPPRKRARC
jgi:DNA-directed RNA polymerase specialized sigma24 family protein